MSPATSRGSVSTRAAATPVRMLAICGQRAGHSSAPPPSRMRLPQAGSRSASRVRSLSQPTRPTSPPTWLRTATSPPTVRPSGPPASTGRRCMRSATAQDGPNGVYSFGAGFPTNTFDSTNYWVDVVFERTLPGDTTPPTVTSVSPVAGASGVGTNSSLAAQFSEGIDPATVTTSSFELRGPGGALVPANVSTSGSSAMLSPNSSLAGSTAYTATRQGRLSRCARPLRERPGSRLRLVLYDRRPRYHAADRGRRRSGRRRDRGLPERTGHRAVQRGDRSGQCDDEQLRAPRPGGSAGGGERLRERLDRDLGAKCSPRVRDDLHGHGQGRLRRGQGSVRECACRRLFLVVHDDGAGGVSVLAVGYEHHADHDRDGRYQPDGGRRAVPSGRLGLRDRDPLLQGRRQCGDACRPFVDCGRAAARDGDVRERDGLGLAGGQSLVARSDCGEHRVHRLVLRAAGPLLARSSVLPDGIRQRAAARSRRRDRRRQRPVLLRRGVPDGQLPGEQLLGRCRVPPYAPTGYDGADGGQRDAGLGGDGRGCERERTGGDERGARPGERDGGRASSSATPAARSCRRRSRFPGRRRRSTRARH